MRVVQCPSSGMIMQLKRLELFREAPDAVLQIVAEQAELVEYVPQDVLHEENEPAESFHGIFRGRVKLLHRTKSGREHLIHVIKGEGQIGLATMFRQRDHPATAVALENTLAVRVSREAITKAAQSDPAFALHLLGIVSLRLRMFVKKLSNQGVSANKRVCRYILHRVLIEQNSQLILKVSREEMANMMGIARETLSRVLGKLVNEGVIAVKGREVKILQLPRLRKMAAWDKEKDEREDSIA